VQLGQMRLGQSFTDIEEGRGVVPAAQQQQNNDPLPVQVGRT